MGAASAGRGADARRWLVVAILVVGVAAVYLIVVVGGGVLVGQTEQPSLLLSLVATAVVAMGFEPARAALRRRFGPSPYERLAGLAETLADTVAIDEVAPRLSRHLCEAANCLVGEVWLASAGSPALPEVAARWPPNAEPIRLGGPGTHRIPVTYNQQVLGWLVLQEGPRRPLEPVENNLVNDLCAQAGLALRHVQLTRILELRIAESERRAAELRASRQRIVSVADAERRRLERDIHDGAQQHLVAMAITSGLARSTLRQAPEGVLRFAPMLSAAVARTSDALQELARGVYPSRLAEQGVAAALAELETVGAVRVRIEDRTHRRFPPDVEAAAYFICLEAVQNAVKHSGAHLVNVLLLNAGEQIRLEISDDGHGFDVDSQRAAEGTANIRDRLATVGGRAEIVSTADGTSVRAWIPLNTATAGHR